MTPPAVSPRRVSAHATFLERVRRELLRRERRGTTRAVVEALARAPGAELHETHGSWVVVSGDRAVKIKKPVRFSFMDFGTLAARRRACRDEVRLNEELAPGLYAGVRAVVGTPPYVVPCGDDREAVDYAVEMRRFDERSTMRSVLAAGRLREPHVAALAGRLAAFHAAAPAARGAFPQPTTWRIRALADLEDLAALGVDVHGLRRFCIAAARRQGPVMRGRWAAGLVREGHGDLRADHVLLTSPITVVDRLEFSRTLRMADVADDLAFLAMDLERLGARWAAELLVDAYAAAGGTPAPPALAALFAWRRAIVRAKVALIVRDGPAAREALALAARLAWRARGPVTIAVTGPPASGKSTLARRLGALLEVPVVSSDAVRKAIHGVAPLQRAGEGLYSPGATRATYRELIRRAAMLAAPAGGVIVDATFSDARRRHELVDAVGSVRWIACDAPPATLAERAAERELAGDALSDAGADVALAIARRVRVTGTPRGALVLDTRAPVDELAARAGAWLDQPVRPG